MNGTIECAFSGRLGSAPEPRTSQAGKTWARFSVAVGQGDDVQWINVACFGDVAERACEQLAKGDRCYVEGTIRLNEWTDREGLTRHGLQCAAHYIDKQAPRAHKPRPKGHPAGRDVARPLDTDARPTRGSLAAFDEAIPF